MLTCRDVVRGPSELLNGTEFIWSEDALSVELLLKRKDLVRELGGVGRRIGGEDDLFRHCRDASVVVVVEEE